MSKFLNEAIENGIVEITVHHPKKNCEWLEQEIEKAFGLKKAVVAGAGSNGRFWLFLFSHLLYIFLILDYADKCFISHSGRFNEAKEVASIVQGRFPNLVGRVVINNIGTTIGSHSGPGTLALFFWGDKREN